MNETDKFKNWYSRGSAKMGALQRNIAAAAIGRQRDQPAETFRIREEDEVEERVIAVCDNAGIL